jgi:hypothetical protein
MTRHSIGGPFIITASAGHISDLTGQEIHSSKARPWLDPWIVFTLITGLTLLASQTPVTAALGGNETSVQNDRTHMRAALLRMTRTDRYTVHEMQAPSGTKVREYVSTAGTVFAVAWDGPWQPDLRQVLGTYFEPYLQSVRAAGTRRPGRGPLLIEEPGFVVQQSGHPHAFAGRAYVPLLVPQGVGADVIR